MSVERPTTDSRTSAALAMLFDSLAEREVTYVVPRSYDGLPKRVDGDVDLVVPPEQFDTVLRIATALGFERKSTSSVRRTVDVLAQGASKPRRAVSAALSSPRSTFEMVRRGATHGQGYRNVKLYGHGTVVDVRNHLAYVSPWNRRRIRVHPDIERRFYERRQRAGSLFIPAPADELAHIVAHCVFDKEGTFKPAYVERCTELFAVVSSDSETDAAFRDLLSLQFYRAAGLVYDAVATGAYADLRARLWRFDDY